MLLRLVFDLLMSSSELIELTELTELTELIQNLKKDVKTWNGFRVSFATELQNWDVSNPEEIDQSKEILFPVKDTSCDTSAYDIRESIINKGLKTISNLESLIKNTHKTISTIQDYLGNLI